MENWGLITFRETSLLVGNQSSPLDKQLIANVVAHELAHQVCVCLMCVCVCVCVGYYKVMEHMCMYLNSLNAVLMFGHKTVLIPL